MKAYFKEGPNCFSEMPSEVIEFLQETSTLYRLEQNKKGSTNIKQFCKKLPQVFDGLLTWRLFRLLRKNDHLNQERFIQDAADLLGTHHYSPRVLLELYRNRFNALSNSTCKE